VESCYQKQQKALRLSKVWSENVVPMVGIHVVNGKKQTDIGYIHPACVLALSTALW